MSGITDVARLAGVSKSTASRALTGRGYVSDETRDRVRDAAAELGYVASMNAASLVTGRTQNVCVITPTVRHWYFAEVMEGIQAALIQHRIDLTLYDAAPGSAAREDILHHLLPRRRFDGLIAVGFEPAPEEIAPLHRFGRPVVHVGPGNERMSTVSIDDAEVARRATEHVLDLGHTDIAMLAGEATTHVERDRIGAYSAAMRAAGLTPRVVTTPVSLPGGHETAVDLLADTRRRPTAIVGTSDEVAIGTILAAQRLGIDVPGDLSVVGIDDHEYAAMFRLTTMAQVPKEQGELAVELLLRHIADPDSPQEHITHPTRLVLRSSTARHP